MNGIPTYNHSKPDVETESKPSFFHYAAKISLLAPVLSLLFITSLTYGLKDIKEPWVALVIAGLGLIAPVICFGSFVLAIIALAGMTRHGKEGILVRALLGLVISTLLLGIWGIGFVHGFQMAMQNRKAATAITQAATDLSDNLKTEFAQKGNIDPHTSQASVQQFKSALDKASREMTGNDALVAKAGSAYAAKLQSLSAGYSAALAAIKSPSVLNMSKVEQQVQLQERKELVKAFMAANEKLMGFFTRGESGFRDELVRMNVPPAILEATLKGYRSTATDRNFLLVKIRIDDQRIGTAMLGMLDVLDANWGNWKYNPEKKNVIFQDTAVVPKYNAFFKDMTEAAQQQVQLQSELVKVPDTASAQ